MTTEKKPLATTYVVIILLIIAAGLLYWIFYLKPGLAKIDGLREANLSEEQEIAALENRLAQKAETESRWAAAHEKESFLRTKIPEVSALPEVLGALEELVFSAKLEIGSLNAYEFRDAESYRFIPVSISAQGKMDDLLVLLEGIEQFAHQSLVDNVRLEEDSDSGHRLNLSFDLVFYLEGQAKTMGTEEETAEETA